MGLPFLFADSLRIGSTIIFPYRVLFGRIFLLVGMIIHGAMRNRFLKLSSTCYTLNRTTRRGIGSHGHKMEELYAGGVFASG